MEPLSECLYWREDDTDLLRGALTPKRPVPALAVVAPVVVALVVEVVTGMGERARTARSDALITGGAGGRV